MSQTDNALLLVFAEPGAQLAEEEFHDWYDNEHIPLRQAIPGFHSFTRLVQSDEKKPTWAAIYDVASLDVLQSGAYAALAQTRSEREKDVLKRIALLDRRLYRRNERASVRVKEGFERLKPGNAVLLVLFDADPELAEEAHRWYEEEHIELLKKVPGWLKTSRYELADATVSGTDRTLFPKHAPKFLAIHYYESVEALRGEEFLATITTPWMDDIMSRLQNIMLQTFIVHSSFESV